MRLQSADFMNYGELFEKYLALVAESRSLKEENEILKAKLGISEKQRVDSCPDFKNHSPSELDTPEIDLQTVFTTYSDPLESLLRGARMKSSMKGERDEL